MASAPDLSAVLGGRAPAKKARPAPAAPLPPVEYPRRWLAVDHTLWTLTPAEKKEYGEKMWRELTRGKTPVSDALMPNYLITMGAPGVGKSTVASIFVREYGGQKQWENTVILDYDELIRWHPKAEAMLDLKDTDGKPTGLGYAYAYEHTSDMVDTAAEVLKRLIAARYNLIVQSHEQSTIVEAMRAGYHTALLYVAADRAVALRRLQERMRARGLYLEPGATWESLYDNYDAHYRVMAPWYALWTDLFVAVSNSDQHRYPARGDFTPLDPHPALPSGTPWHVSINWMVDAVIAAREGKRKQTQKAPPEAAADKKGGGKLKNALLGVAMIALI